MIPFWFKQAKYASRCFQHAALCSRFGAGGGSLLLVEVDDDEDEEPNPNTMMKIEWAVSVCVASSRV
jgi:hypothetical protein